MDPLDIPCEGWAQGRSVYTDSAHCNQDVGEKGVSSFSLTTQTVPKNNNKNTHRMVYGRILINKRCGTTFHNHDYMSMYSSSMTTHCYSHSHISIRDKNHVTDPLRDNDCIITHKCTTVIRINVIYFAD